MEGAEESRSAYLARQRERGRAVVGVAPAIYPRELFWACGVLPVEIWDPPVEGSEAGIHLQPTVCPIVKGVLDLVLSRRGKLLDGFLVPHTCDSLQNLATLVHDSLLPELPTWFLGLPRERGPLGRDFLLARLEILAAELGRRFTPIEALNLAQAIGWAKEQDALLSTLHRRRRDDTLGLDNRQFYRLHRLAEWLHPEDHLPLLRAALDAPPVQPRPGQRCVVLSGIVPNPPEVLELLDRHEVLVGADDYLCCGRRLPARPGEAQGLAFCAERLLALPPCSTTAASVAERREHLLNLVLGCSARGVIFHVPGFCEPELFYLPRLVEALQRQKVPSLLLETEFHRGLDGRSHTRIEAFLEQLEG